MPAIFISYAHKDEDWKDRLVTQLSVLQTQFSLDIWNDRRIEAGANWFNEIETAINTANIAILMISANFLSSQFITNEEIPRLLLRRQQDGIRIFPVIIKPCDWQGVDWLAAIQARPKDGRPLANGTESLVDTDLAAIAKEIRELLQRTGAPRKQKNYVPLPPEHISLAKLPTTSHALFGREKELELLDKAWQNSHCHIFTLMAAGGVGKTALVNAWLNGMEQEHYRGAQRVYGWSFYSQGTREDKQAAADTFFENALTFFGYTGEPLKSPWDKGKLLATLIKQQPTLLILDGLEPLQYPPGELAGGLRDQGLQALLKELARFNHGLSVITTRCPVTDLESTLNKTTHQLDLENLSPEAGRQLLRETGVTQGTDQELEAAAREYEGHALALTLLGSYMATVCKGEIRQRDLIPQLTEDMKHGGHANRVMESYEIWLKGTAELEILYLMGLFDRPAPMGAINAVLKAPPPKGLLTRAVSVLFKKNRIQGLTDKLSKISDKEWHYAVKHLRDLRLLAASDHACPDTLDCHPLVREHFGEKLRRKEQSAWRMTHERLYEYYKNLPKKELPDTLEEMEPLFAAVAHGCQAGKHQEVLYKIYWERIRRKEEAYTVHKLGAFGADLSALSNFFEVPWRKVVPNLTEVDQAVTLSWAGYRLRALGRLREAAQPMQVGMEMVVKQKDWKQASIHSGNLSELFLTLGGVAAAVSWSSQSVDFADRSGDRFQKMLNRTTLADAQHQVGELAAAAALFQEAESLQAQRQPEYRYLYSVQGFRYCDLLLSQGQVREVLTRAEQTIEISIRNRWLLTIALDKLSLGRAYLLQASEQMTVTSQVTVNLKQAADYLNQAVTGLRESGNQDDLPRGLFARAQLYRLQQDFPRAWEDLAEAQELAERGAMKLFLVDYHIEAARIVNCQLRIDNCQLMENGREVVLNREEMLARLKKHVEQAAALVQETGYHRRDPEVEMGYASLFFAQKEPAKAREHLAKAKALLDKMGIRMWDWEIKALEKQIERG